MSEQSTNGAERMNVGLFLFIETTKERNVNMYMYHISATWPSTGHENDNLPTRLHQHPCQLKWKLARRQKWSDRSFLRRIKYLLHKCIQYSTFTQSMLCRIAPFHFHSKYNSASHFWMITKGKTTPDYDHQHLLLLTTPCAILLCSKTSSPSIHPVQAVL